jgi:hypothetical protein
VPPQVVHALLQLAEFVPQDHFPLLALEKIQHVMFVLQIAPHHPANAHPAHSLILKKAPVLFATMRARF